MKIVYVCSPYSGDIEANTEYARKACRHVVDSGYIPIAPHLLLPQFMSEETERELAMLMNRRILRWCDELWVFGNRISAGMKSEISQAEFWRIPIERIGEDV